MAAFKDQLDAAAGGRLASEISAAWPEFDRRSFTRGLALELESLELLARGDELARRLQLTLPGNFSEAAEVLYRALDSPAFTGWLVLPCGGFVARAGIDDPDTALPLLAALTPRWSSEFAIRPLLVQHPAVAYGYLRRWCRHPDEHVRRLVSEGTRPRLPWAPLLRDLVADPSPNIPLLEALVEDPSAYVRRSVANHLNDISKDHPGTALELAGRWSGRGDRAAWVARHGLRTLVKRGDFKALAVIGADTGAAVDLVELRVDPERVAIGDAATFSFVLRVPDDGPGCEAVIDYRVHYAGVRATKAPKVFKLARRRLEPGRPVRISRVHRFGNVSIRRVNPGRHRIDIQVNGLVLGAVDLDVTDA